MLVISTYSNQFSLRQYLTIFLIFIKYLSRNILKIEEKNLTRLYVNN